MVKESSKPERCNNESLNGPPPEPPPDIPLGNRCNGFPRCATAAVVQMSKKKNTIIRAIQEKRAVTARAKIVELNLCFTKSNLKF